MPVTQITCSSDFKRAIAQNKLVVVDFYAIWCGPCKVIAPKFESFSNTYPQAAFIKVNVDDLPDVSSSCGVRAMPTFQFYRSSKKLGEVVGANVYQIETLIKQHISGSTPSTFQGTGHVLGSGEKVGEGSNTAQGPQPAPIQNNGQNFIYVLLALFIVYWFFGKGGDSDHLGEFTSW